MSERRLLPVLLTIALLAAVGGMAANSGDDDREFKAVLRGANEVPPVVTDATGKAEFEVNRDQTKIKFELTIRNATNILGAAGAHIHCAPEGVNGPVVAFLAGLVNGGFDGKVEIEATLSDANVIAGSACGTTIADLVEAMRAGNTYVNAHSPAFPGGEIRGQIEGD
jgi:hypothetical protein